MSASVIALTVDVEGSLIRLPARIEQLLGLFARSGVKATFFVLGKAAESVPAVVRQLVGAGHEIGFHGYEHVPIGKLSPLELTRQLTDWRRRLEDLAQQPVRGFRAPFFSIHRHTAWALSSVAQAGFGYDSSILPGLSDRFGWLGAPKSPVRIRETSLVVFPVPVLCDHIPIAFSGGGYLRLFPWPLITWALNRRLRQGRPAMVYLHPWEIEPRSSKSTQPVSFLPRCGWAGWREALTGQIGRKPLLKRLERLLSEPQKVFRSMGEVVSSLHGLPGWEPGELAAAP